MAELASGAVSSLLGLLRNEALLLSRVGSDSEFIKEEMESMHSFLEHLARTAPPAGSGGHDEQVRTWMKQIPRKEAAPTLPSSSQAAATQDKEEEEDDDDDQNQATDGSYTRQRALEPRLLEEYCTEKLANWLETNEGESITSIALVVPDDMQDAGAIARDSLTSPTANFMCKVVNLSALHLPWDLPLLPSEILCYILRECKQHQGTEQGELNVPEGDLREKVCRYKNELLDEVWDMIGYREVDEKIEEIRNMVGEVEAGKIGGVDRKKVEENICLVILLHALRLRQKAPDMGMPLSSNQAIEETASSLKAHMETGESKPQICLDDAQYKDILHNLFLTNKPPQSQQVQEATSSATTMSVDHTKEIIHNHKITLDIILGLLPKQQLPEGTSTKEQVTDAAASVIKQKENSKEIAGEVTNAAAAAASVIKETKEKTKEVSEEVISAIASAVIKETKLKMETSGELARDIASALVKETKEKLKELSAEVTSAIASAVIKETTEKMKEMQITSAIAAAVIEEAKEKMKKILRIKVLVDKIKPHLENKKTLIILQDDQDYVSAGSRWEETRNALKLLGCRAVIVSTKNSQKATEFCHPPGVEPITYSLVGLYHDTVLELTKARMNKGNDGYTPNILREILAKCHPHEFCMKIFTYALYANPNRSYEELCKLHEDLVPHKTFGSKAKKMIKFSYKDLPREHKTCLLYLAIFPQGQNIKRSTLIGRWVTEGLITKQDWATAVHHAEQCFDTLIERGLLFPDEIGAAGKVKSCILGDQVHGFITKVASKEHILDARLSDLWARHFSIFSGLRLRASDGIDNFVHKLPKYSPQLPLLKVLDLEGTECFEKNHYLRDICNKILLLKYLSLRRTNVRYLPSEINNLHELEVLDIRQTMVPERATRDVLLLKLRRFLANRVDPNPGLNDKSPHFPVQIPSKIEKMENLEVLSSVKASGDGRELKEIKNLWQLRKLGVVIEDRVIHLTRLLQAISDLKDCLRSLSVTISCNTRTKSILSSKEGHAIDVHRWLRQTPKHLQNLSINGVTEKVQLLEPLAKGSDELAKVTLAGTVLKQDDLMVLAVLPKLHCVRLRSKAYNESKLTFKEEEFQQLKYFIVEGNMTETDIEFQEVEFQDGATAELEKVVLSFTNIRFLSGIDNLPKLKELDLEGNRFLLSFAQDEASPEQSTKIGSAEQNTEGGSTEPNTQSRAPEQNSESRAPEHNTESRATEPNTQSRAPEQNIESRAPEHNTQGRTTQEITRISDPEQSNEHNTPEQDSQNTAPKQNTDTRAEQNTGSKSLDQNTENRVAEGITQSRDPEQSNERKAPEQDSQSTTPKQNTETTAEQNTESRAPDKNNESKAAKGNTQSTASEQNLKSRVPEQNTQSRAPEQNPEGKFIFKKGKFKHLKYVRVEDSRMIDIMFESGAAPELKKIALSLTNEKSQLDGVSGLKKLKEIELKGGKFLLSSFHNANQISKVTLRDTQLKQEDIRILAKKKNLRCLELSDLSYAESELAFNKDEFPALDLLIVECRAISSISFTDGSAPKIERIVWSFDEMKSLSGIDKLLRLKEIECIGNHVPHQDEPQICQIIVVKLFRHYVLVRVDQFVLNSLGLHDTKIYESIYGVYKLSTSKWVFHFDQLRSFGTDKGCEWNVLIGPVVYYWSSLQRLYLSQCANTLWWPLSRPEDRDAISAFIADLRSMAVRLSLPPPPPLPEPS
ncbi:Disease resistance protein RPM1 [Triticum urartu]|uniref:Disease resistance protein RPM1 n=1 Tax=Triticum urartu TaxID=4572 RepID=M7Z8V3_TRIUA|nr:Disease resistance protein RPM1 [Triticum urartu]